jgi:chromosome partitioning protein
MIVIAIVNSKGGVGRTTLASALAVRAAQDSKRVCMVDLDPQKSLVAWWKRRGRTDNPTIFEGADTATDAILALEQTGWDWVFLDGPPNFLSRMEEMIQLADFVLIPCKASMIDLLASEGAVALARQDGASFTVVFNEVQSRERIIEKAREMLFNVKVPIANTAISRRASHITGMAAGKSAAEVNGGRDAAAAEEIDALWREVKSAAIKGARIRAKHREAANG